MENEKMVVEYKSQVGDPLRLTMAMVKRYLVSGRAELVTDQEIVYFMHTCKARKLNPFTRDCWLIKYDQQPAAIVVSRDYFTKNARRAGDCRGWRGGIIALDKDGQLVYRDGTLIMDGEQLVGGWAEAKPAGWDEPYRLTVNLNPYIKKTKEGRPTKFWEPEKQPEMICKVAEVQLLRKLWGEESTGLYTPEEVSLEDIDQKTVDIKPENFRVLDKELTLKPKTYEKAASNGDDKDQAPQDAASPPPADPATSDPVADPGVQTPGNAWDDLSAWGKLRGPGFATFAHKNRDAWQGASQEAQAAAVDKWGRIYEEPVPAWMAVAYMDAIPPMEDAGPMQEPDLDLLHGNEDAQRGKMITHIQAEYPPEIIFQAKKALGFPAAPTTWPVTLEGVSRILDQCIVLLEDKENR